MALFGRETQQDHQRAADYAHWVQQRNPLAIVSLVLGTFSLIEFGAIPIFSLGGLIFGIIALRQLARPDPSPPLGRRLAWTGVALSGVALATGATLYLHPILFR
jgi:hypothetical protein